MTAFEQEMEKRLKEQRADISAALEARNSSMRAENLRQANLKENVDQMSAEQLLFKQEALHQHEVNRIKAIDGAISRINNGTYGICARCGKKISEDRLRAIPWALLCIDCKNDSEKKAR